MSRDYPTTWREAFLSLESAVCDARNMASLTSGLSDPFPADGEEFIFAICHTANLIDGLHKDWTRLVDELSEQNVGVA